ncbi:hypothetical protein SLS53_003704 [Cytospora paraplurivora]|uniref:Uncharacterized protein n=1 Tax=Cytospora paraplurivora TaxID=2898453 RepID=A0AAN9YGS0_9PEZI
MFRLPSPSNSDAAAARTAQKLLGLKRQQQIEIWLDEAVLWESSQGCAVGRSFGHIPADMRGPSSPPSSSSCSTSSSSAAAAPSSTTTAATTTTTSSSSSSSSHKEASLSDNTDPPPTPPCRVCNRQPTGSEGEVDDNEAAKQPTIAETSRKTRNSGLRIRQSICLLRSAMGSLKVTGGRTGGGGAGGAGGAGGGKCDRVDNDDDEVGKKGGEQARKNDPASSTRMFRVATDVVSSDDGPASGPDSSDAGGRQGLDGRLARLRRAQKLLERSSSQLKVG